jgi:methylmalonyl-CoA/ethylmalonyl-CoA epimerase
VTATPDILTAGSRFHHIGVACRNLDRDREGFALLGYAPAGDSFIDPAQGIEGQFLEGPGPRLELLVSHGDGKTLEPWLKGRAKMYHLAYEVDELDHAREAAREAGGRQVSEPVPSVAFEGRRICFLMLPNLQLLELIET